MPPQKIALSWSVDVTMKFLSWLADQGGWLASMGMEVDPP